MIGETISKQEVIEQLDTIQSALMADGASRSVEKALDVAIAAVEKEFDITAIKVGDECRYKSSRMSFTFIITYIDEDEDVFSAIYTNDGDTITAGTLSMIEKTGRHFETVSKLLEEVRA